MRHSQPSSGAFLPLCRAVIDLHKLSLEGPATWLRASMKDRVAKSIFWVVWSRGIMQLLSFGTTIIVARWLDPSDYGLMALASTFISVLSLVCELGLGAAVVQFPDLDERELNLSFYIGLGTACIIYAILFFGAPAIAIWFNSPRLTDVLRVASLVLPIGVLAIIPFGLVQKRLELDRAAKAEISAGLIALVAVVSLAWHGAGVWALIGGSLARTAVWAGVLYCYSPWRPGLRIRSTRLRQILKFSFGTFGSRALWSIYDQSDNFVLGKVTGEFALGFYTMARDLANIPVTRISTVVNQLSVPIMANLQKDPAAMRAMLLRALRLTASVSVPVCVGIALVARDLVYIALSEKWMLIVPILRVLSGMALIKSIDVLIAPVLRARYRTTFLAMYNLGLLIVMPIAFLIGAHLGGGVGVAWAWLVAYPLVMSRMATEALHEIGLPWREIFRQLRGPMIAAALMTLAVLGLQSLITGERWGIALTRLLLASGVGATVYAGSLWILGGPLRDEMLEILTWVFKPNRSKAR